ncbi:ABC transporter substrate-binding protein [Synechococcus sp. PCC 7336]|uniref:substrate-binding periplasmic protein n=1 Tax=Synechococcus sp. PCC 7336 TaxID=195250 RepID=UPI00034CDEB1|nr:transporter substrate-binding domain-containing protein [Synechococcus sp. PCC 7336]
MSSSLPRHPWFPSLGSGLALAAMLVLSGTLAVLPASGQADSEVIESPDTAVEAATEGSPDADAATADPSDAEIAAEASPDLDIAGSEPAADLQEETAEAEPEPPEDRYWSTIQRRGELRVGLDPSIGYTYLLTNPLTRSYDGFEYDILEAIADTLDIALVPVNVPWEGQLDALQEGRVDMILGGREPYGLDREQFAATVPYYQSPQHIVVRSDLDGTVERLSDLFGRKVGVVANSTGAAVLEVYNDNRGNAIRLFATSNPERLFEQLRDGLLDAAIVDRPVAVAKIFAPGLTPADVAAPIPAATEPAATEMPIAEGEDTAGGEDITEASAPVEAVLWVAEQTPASDFVMVGEPIFPTPLVGAILTEHASLKQAVDGAIAQLQESGMLAAILEKWEL